MSDAATDSYIAVIIIKDCIGCALCIEACEVEAIPQTFTGYISTIAQIDKNLCNGCGKCLPLCPQNAIKLVKISYSQY